MTDEDFKYLVEEFGSENLGLLKQQGAYSHEYMDSFERFKEKKLPPRKCFYSSTQGEKIGDDGKNSDGHVSLRGYLKCEKIWDKFDIKDMGNYHNHYLNKDVLLLADVIS